MSRRTLSLIILLPLLIVYWYFVIVGGFPLYIVDFFGYFILPAIASYSFIGLLRGEIKLANGLVYRFYRGTGARLAGFIWFLFSVLGILAMIQYRHHSNLGALLFLSGCVFGIWFYVKAHMSDTSKYKEWW